MFESPLKAGMVVKCTDGLLVEILSDPRARYNSDDGYEVDVRYLSGGLSGDSNTFGHEGPDRFIGSIFEGIYSSSADIPGSLEHEFFHSQGQAVQEPS